MADLELLEEATQRDDEAFPSYEEIVSWKKIDMVEWLSSRKMPKSGNKDVLAKRIFRSMRQTSSDEGDSMTDSDGECKAEPEMPVPTPESLTTGWNEVTEGAITVLEEKDIENYFVHHKDPLSGKEGNFQRQMVKARKLANEKHVNSLEYNVVNDKSSIIYIRGKCFPTVRQSVQVETKSGSSTSVQQYTQIITLSKSSSFVIRAKCNCKAGVAGLCAHVGGCLFVLSRITKPSCTSTACSWTKPPMKNPPAPERWEDILFVNTEYKTPEEVQSVKPLPGVYQAGPCSDADQFLADLLRGLGDVNPSCVLYTTMCSRKDDISPFLQSYQPDVSVHDSVDLNKDSSQEHISTFISNIHRSVTEEMCTGLQQATLGQHNNQNWKSARSVLITSSNFGAVCKRKPTTRPDNLVKIQRGYKELPDGIKNIAHGRKNEPKARKMYAQFHREQCGVNISVTEAGLHVDPKTPFLGTSVDGMVDCPKCGRGVVEIKCPYGNKNNKWRRMTVEECCSDPSFCCELDPNNKMTLIL